MKIDIKKLKKISENLKLLYIEDDEVARATMLEMLGRFFKDITIAVDGRDGLETFKNGSFDLILTDINMPHMTGIEMLSEIRKFDTNIPVLVISAHNESDFFLKTLKLGVDDYILKPLEHNQFILAIQKVVEKIDLKKQVIRYQNHLEEEVQNRTLELQKKLYYDDLTSVLSRYSFFEDIKSMDMPVIFFIDIDKFKVINEIYGTSTGSLVLKKFAKFLLDFVESTSYKVYRLSADEFILADNVEYIEHDLYEKFVENLLEKLSCFQVILDDDFITIDVTIGISVDQKDLLECAKIALEFAKENKKAFMTYSIEIDSRQEKKDALIWKNKIKSAIEDKRIVPVYQAIVDQTGEIVKYETLMRLRDKDTQKLISPFFFLDIAIKTRLYDTLSSTIIFNALELIASSGATLSINFTFSDIKNRVFIDNIAQYLDDRKNLGKQLVFEIKESESIENYGLVKEFIYRFRSYGVKFAIDDFGSGFSNFEYILDIQPDYLKIDGSLVKKIDTDESAYILVKAIVEFSHKLGIKIIAEFVHNETVFNMLKDLDVDEYQGFYFYEPLEELS
ncbi:MAG: EAL domain-containing protein [Campylobacterota bacterium]|nr:EAL domain-containing protein [Campylobacterota bacterium]